MFQRTPRKSTVSQVGDTLLALAALPVLAVVWIASKVIGAFTDNA